MQQETDFSIKIEYPKTYVKPFTNVSPMIENDSKNINVPC